MNRLQALEELLKTDPQDPLIRYGLANEYFKAGNYQACIEQINAYLSLAEDEGAVYRTLAKAFLNLGDKQQARKAYEAGIEAARKHNHSSMVEEYLEAIEYDLQ
ncbi:MAG: tetratricopeptide repeat protein [Acidobacteriota bacterium]|nr:tetratricopeptide repeat protein [Blastocatellia bacterium]MDW8411315.1 tetratricopeptide repeat protein [Acidobacteriota bacterium]